MFEVDLVLDLPQFVAPPAEDIHHAVVRNYQDFRRIAVLTVTMHLLQEDVSKGRDPSLEANIGLRRTFLYQPQDFTYLFLPTPHFLAAVTQKIFHPILTQVLQEGKVEFWIFKLEERGWGPN